ncbi:LacI family DNA-binding transcriptional regulator [Nibricoccus sp. IMCC34717]|uniref:LacI family DNA-binding transcriptional regulator n=1 Tax=Nibricoccus sp. IMCC34717 TaxID=3034021 RepID=UPI00384ADDF9
MSKVSLQTIAAHVGCTRATVSYALNHSSSVSAATKAKIWKVAEELGWTPNPELARQMALVRTSLAGKSSSTMAVVLQRKKSELMKNLLQRKFFEGACSRAERLGFKVDVFNLAEDPMPPRRLRDILQARSIHGVVYIATLGEGLSEEHLEVGRGFVSAVVSIRYPKIGFHVAITDFLANGLLMFENLRAAGFKRIGVALPGGVDGPLGWSFSGSLYAGHLQVFGSGPLPIFYSKSDKVYFDKEDAKALTEWVADGQFDALITSDPANSVRLLSGQKTPRPKVFSTNYDSSFASGDGGIDQRNEAVGASGVDLVVAQLHRGESGVPEIQKSVQVAGVWRWHNAGA